MSAISAWARAVGTGLSSLRDRAALRLAALRFNPSRCLGYAMIAAPFVAMYTFSFLTLTLFQATTVVIVPWLILAWLAKAIRLLMR